MKLVVCIVLATSIAILSALTPGCSPSKWKSISQGGAGHTIAIREDGTLWGWGDNRECQLAVNANTSNHSSTPKQIGNDTNWKTVSVGYYHSLAIKEDGTLWGWGNNDFGQLGNTSKKVVRPVQIGNESNWIAVDGGDWHTVAIKGDGTLWGCGKNTDGQLGDGTKKNQVNMTQIGTENDWASVSAGFSFTLATKKTGSLWGWGKNQYFQLGNNNAVRDVAAPIQIGTANWKSVSAGLHGSAGIQVDNSLWIWGCAFFQDCKELLKEPTAHGTDTNWKSVVIADYAGLALNNDGAFFAWGDNDFGQFGDGQIGNYRKELAQIGIDSDWEDIKAGQTFTLGVKKDGRLLSWGGNGWGQLGFGYRKEYEVLALPGACAIGAGCMNNSCVQCPASTVLIGYECVPCDPSCAECEGYTNRCTKCPPGKLLNYSFGLCDDSCSSNCKNCKNRPTACTECHNPNEYINQKNGSKCQTCSPNCLTCTDNPNKCTSCPDGKFVKNDNCAKCSGECATCQKFAIMCTSCKAPNATLTMDNKCVLFTNITNNISSSTTTIEVVNSGIPAWLIILIVINVIVAALIGYWVGFRQARKTLLDDRLTDKELEL